MCDSFYNTAVLVCCCAVLLFTTMHGCHHTQILYLIVCIAQVIEDLNHSARWALASGRTCLGICALLVSVNPVLRSMCCAISRSANPRNDLRTNNTFLAVEVLGMGRKWLPIYTDNDLSTQFHWHKPTRLDPFSKATVRWEIGDEVDEGLYRLRHFGNYKTVLGGIFEFEGTSRTFYVRPRQQVPKAVAEITVI